MNTSLWATILAITIWVLFSSRLGAQNSLPQSVTGDWVVKDDTTASLYTDYWRIKSDGTFCELKFASEDSPFLGLVCDGFGHWRQEEDRFTLIFEGEDGKLARQSLTIEFILSVRDNGLILQWIDQNHSSARNSLTKRLLLTKYEY